VVNSEVATDKEVLKEIDQTMAANKDLKVNQLWECPLWDNLNK
jgi:hypothetical protein